MRTPDILRVIAVVLMTYAVIATLQGPISSQPAGHLHASAVP